MLVLRTGGIALDALDFVAVGSTPMPRAIMCNWATHLKPLMPGRAEEHRLIRPIGGRMVGRPATEPHLQHGDKR